MSDVVDPARPVRAGEELDVARLERYLGEKLGLAGPLSLQQFPGGHSNLTYLITSGAEELVLRRPPFGSKVKGAHDMGREFRVLSRLSKVYPLAPSPLALCDDPEVLGAPFYVMKRIRGLILRRHVPEGIDLGPGPMRRLCESFVDALAALHAVDYVAAGLGELGKPEGYNRRQVTGWTKRYADSKTDDIAEVERIAGWLAARIPGESGATLIHNDYKFDNLVLAPDDPTRVIGVLDWEMSTLGDPLMDLGTALSYWVEAGDSDEVKMLPFGLPPLPGAMTRRELAARYAEKTGRDVSNLLFYFCFSLFKTAVVAQQIYYRYAQGLTKDPRFAAMIHGVRILATTALRAAAAGHY